MVIDGRVETVLWENERRARRAAGDDVAVCAGPRLAWARARRIAEDLALCIVTSIDGIELPFVQCVPRFKATGHRTAVPWKLERRSSARCNGRLTKIRC